MYRKKALAITAIVIAAIFILFATILPANANKNCDSISGQSAKDDCYHVLAHETGDKTICSKILDSEKKEHCFGHIPE